MIDQLINNKKDAPNIKLSQLVIPTCCYFLSIHCIHSELWCASSEANQQEALQMDIAGGIKHCHDNSRAQEDRDREKKVARRRLYVVTVICLIFMIGEILGESFLFFSHLKKIFNPFHLSLPLILFLFSIPAYIWCLFKLEHLMLSCLS